MNFIFGVETEAEITNETLHSCGYGDDIVCLITDIFFPKGSDLTYAAGKDLIRLCRTYFPRIPIIIASKTKEADVFRKTNFVLPKGDPGSLETLKKYIQDYTGMGDFIILNKQGTVLHRVKNISEMMGILDKADEDSKDAEELRELLNTYGEKDLFSTWLYMHSFRELADELRPKRVSDLQLVPELKKYLSRELRKVERTPLILDDNKIYNLQDMIGVLKRIDPAKLQEFSDNDIISSWLDRQGYTELAEELRPIHGSGKKLVRTLIDIFENPGS